MPFLSVIVPVFNKADYFDMCVESILMQTFKDFELILVNDGSTDESGMKCESYRDRYPGIKVIHQENMGVSAARNAGINISTGEFLGFVDGDDTIEPDMYEILIHNALSNGSDVSVCSMNKVRPGKNKRTVNSGRIEIYDKDQGLSAMLAGDLDMSANNKIFRAEVIRNFNLRFEGRFKEDFLFNVLVFSVAEKSVFQDTAKYNYILRESSVSIEKFSEKDMEGLKADENILSFVSEKMKKHEEEAKVNFFVQNLYTLNLILLSSRKKNAGDYKIVTENLKRYSYLLKSNGLLGAKYRSAYSVFRMCPMIYTLFLELYVLIIPSEVGVRRR